MCSHSCSQFLVMEGNKFQWHMQERPTSRVAIAAALSSSSVYFYYAFISRFSLRPGAKPFFVSG